MYIQKAIKSTYCIIRMDKETFAIKALKISGQQNSKEFSSADSRLWETNSVPIFGVSGGLVARKQVSYSPKRRETFTS